MFPLVRHAHRTSGFFKVRGINISHAEFEDFMFANAAVNDFKCEIVSSVDDLDCMRVSVELARGSHAERRGRASSAESIRAQPSR